MIDRFKKMFLFLSIAYIVLGLIMIFNPQNFIEILCYVFGGIIIVYGLFNVIAYLSGRNSYDGPKNSELIRGVVSLFIGLFLVIRPAFIVNIFAVVLGIAVLIDGIYDLQLAVDIKENGYDKWFIHLITAIITIILALIIIFTSSGIELMTVFIGISLLFDGLTNIFAIISIKRLLR